MPSNFCSSYYGQSSLWADSTLPAAQMSELRLREARWRPKETDPQEVAGGQLQAAWLALQAGIRVTHPVCHPWGALPFTGAGCAFAASVIFIPNTDPSRSRSGDALHASPAATSHAHCLSVATALSSTVHQRPQSRCQTHKSFHFLS